MLWPLIVEISIPPVGLFPYGDAQPGRQQSTQEVV